MNKWTFFISVLHSSSSSKEKNRFSLRNEQRTTDTPTVAHWKLSASFSNMGGRKEKIFSSSWTGYKLQSIISTNHATFMWPSCDSFCFSWWTCSSVRDDSRDVAEMQILKQLSAPQARFWSVEHLWWTESTTRQDVWLICVSGKLLLGFQFCMYRECFATEKKEIHSNSLKNWGDAKQLQLLFFLCVCLS